MILVFGSSFGKCKRWWDLGVSTVRSFWKMEPNRTEWDPNRNFGSVWFGSVFQFLIFCFLFSVFFFHLRLRAAAAKKLPFFFDRVRPSIFIDKYLSYFAQLLDLWSGPSFPCRFFWWVSLQCIKTTGAMVIESTKKTWEWEQSMRKIFQWTLCNSKN